MPPTLVHAALGVLVAAVLLPHDRRALAVAGAAAALPDLDALLAVAAPGLHGAALHNLFLPAILAVAVRWESHRPTSWLRETGRLRLAWAALLAFVLVGIAPDLLNVDAAAPLWPVHDRFYSVVGRLELSSRRGLFQTFVGAGWDVGARAPGYCQPSALTQSCPASRLAIVESGWQLLVVLIAAGVVAVAEIREVVD